MEKTKAIASYTHMPGRSLLYCHEQICNAPVARRGELFNRATA
ncbi:MAG: hypothetical protein SFY66_18515 [Oculatellaceae cyanobacterium bins.114]|nr:hypothetical protein [Oculatellaceae cyanobacterium bins.114]